MWFILSFWTGLGTVVIFMVSGSFSVREVSHKNRLMLLSQLLHVPREHCIFMWYLSKVDFEGDIPCFSSCLHSQICNDSSLFSVRLRQLVPSLPVISDDILSSVGRKFFQVNGDSSGVCPGEMQSSTVRVGARLCSGTIIEEFLLWASLLHIVMKVPELEVITIQSHQSY